MEPAPPAGAAAERQGGAQGEGGADGGAAARRTRTRRDREGARCAAPGDSETDQAAAALRFTSGSRDRPSAARALGGRLSDKPPAPSWSVLPRRRVTSSPSGTS